MFHKSHKTHSPPADTLPKLMAYFGVMGIGLLLIWALLTLGPGLEAGKLMPAAAAAGESSNWFQDLLGNLQHPLALFFLQILVIVSFSRIVGMLVQKIGQPFVMGEILAGILLGPSLMGMAVPAFSAFLFPKASLPPLQLISQLGLIFFMFIIGLELDPKLLKNQTYPSLLISHVGIVFPFLLGVGVAVMAYRNFAPEPVGFLSFALFMGISMSITAFPVLARIIQERKLYNTSYGSLALTCAAIDDVTAWCLLALVVAIVGAHSLVGSLVTVLLSAGYIFVMFALVKPWLAHRLKDQIDEQGQLPQAVMAGVLIFALMSALFTEVIGIHALFGGFLAGAIMPTDSKFRHAFIERIESISLLVLLPLFFTFTGLRTQIGLLNQPALWGMAALVCAAAILGKFGGAVGAGRMLKLDWAESCRIGILLNTRGLMELIVLNIGYDMGILSAEMFTMLVLMALITTFMTGPALTLVDKIQQQP